MRIARCALRSNIVCSSREIFARIPRFIANDSATLRHFGYVRQCTNSTIQSTETSTVKSLSFLATSLLVITLIISIYSLDRASSSFLPSHSSASPIMTTPTNMTNQSKINTLNQFLISAKTDFLSSTHGAQQWIIVMGNESGGPSLSLYTPLLFSR